MRSSRKYIGSIRYLVAFLTLLLSVRGGLFAQDLLPSEGLFVKVGVERSGAYKLSYEKLRELGFSSPENVGVFGFGGALLSEKLAEAPREVLPAVPVWHHGEALYFYAQGPLAIAYDSQEKRLFHTTNHYATAGYYFLSDALPKKELETNSYSPSGTLPDAPYYNGYYLHERELYSLKQSGRMLVGEILSGGTKLAVKLSTSETVLDDGSARLSVSYVSLPKEVGTLTLRVGGELLLEDQLHRSEDRTPASYLRGIHHLRRVPMTASARGEVDFELSFAPAFEKAHLDYIALETHNRLAYESGRQTLFRYLAEHSTPLRFQLANLPDDAQLWAIASPNRVERLPLDNGGFVASPQKEDDQPLEFLLFRPEEAYTPIVIGKKQFRNLRHHEGIPALIIITTESFRHEAERLARFHRERRGLNVLVATQEEVYNEFSSGTPDATAYRLLAKHFYDLWCQTSGETDSNLCPINLLLFGDGAADNRLLSSDWQQLKNSGVEMLLTYQSHNSLNVDSYVADDYFGLVTEGEDHLHNGAKRVSIGVGRFTVRTLAEARMAVDKSIAYAENRWLGDWKLRSVMVADDADGYGHLRRGEELSKVIQEEVPPMLMTKVYFDAFPKENRNGLTTFPAAQRKLFDALDKGVLILNYTGHGNPNAWSDEQILTVSDILRFNYQQLPLWITATCDFANFDNPITSGGEVAFLNPTSGAIGLVTTSRVVYDIYNQQLNVAFLRELFKKKDSGEYISFGEALKRSKNALKNTFDETGLINKLHFFFIGDPSLSLNLPTHRAVVEEVNGKPTGGDEVVELTALERVKVAGSVRDFSNSIAGNFSGEMAVTVFDSEATVKTLEANRPPHLERDEVFTDYTGLIYAGTTKVEGGFFDLEFTIPRDVSYNESTMRINLYAYSYENGQEAMGVDNSSQIVKGVSTMDLDTIPPEIRRCFLNDSTLQDSFVTGPTPIFYAEIFDESGINLSSAGVGHSVLLSIDNRPDYTFVLNDYYRASPLEAGLGEVTFTLPPLDEGDHQATFSVWDVFNNVSTHSFSFRVHHELKPQIMLSKVYPNPLPQGQPLALEIATSAPGEQFEGFVELFDFRGELLYRSEPFGFKSTLAGPATVSLEIGTSYGTNLPKGLYLLRLTATNSSQKKSSATAKLVVIDTTSGVSHVE